MSLIAPLRLIVCLFAFVLIDTLAQVFGRDGDGIAGEFWHVVAFQQQDVVFGITLGEAERFVCLSLLVEVGDEWA